MGYITFNIIQDDQPRDFILFHAEYINEAWVAEVREDNSTRILREWECRNLLQCIDEIVLCIDHLGEVVKMIPSDIDPVAFKILEDRLMHESMNTKDLPKLPIARALHTNQIWDWLSHPFADFRIAN